MSVHLITEEQTFSLARDGKPSVQVRVVAGDLVVRDYRGQAPGRQGVITARSGGELRRQLDAIDEEVKRKAARAAALKEAAAAPVPALVYSPRRSAGSTLLTPVGVRGVDRRLGKALVTYGSGVKGSVEPTYLLRPLTDAELVALEAAAQEVYQAQRDQPAGKNVWEAKDEQTTVVRIRFDVAEDRWKATHADVVVVGETAREVEAKVENGLLLQRYAYGVGRPLGREHGAWQLTELITPGHLYADALFETREAALEFVAGEERLANAREALRKLLDGLLFDLSRWDTA
jgi:hypothetical protein